MEKILPSILAALIPFIATYLSKLNKASVRKNLMEDAQKKIDFLDKYFQVSSKFLHETEIESLKLQLSAEIQEVKSQVSSLDKQENRRSEGISHIFPRFGSGLALGSIFLHHPDIFCFPFLGVFARRSK